MGGWDSVDAIGPLSMELVKQEDPHETVQLSVWRAQNLIFRKSLKFVLAKSFLTY